MPSVDRCSKEDFERWLKDILRDKDIRDYEVDVQGLTEKGDGYLGDITFVKVSGKTKSGEPKHYDFVVKCGKLSKQLRETIPVRLAFENEICVYEKVLPAFETFQKEKGVEELFDNYPRNYGSLIFDEMEVLFLENQKVLGFELYDRKKPMNFEHIATVVEQYGKLHAISYAMKDQQPELFKSLAGKLEDVFLAFSKEPPPEGYQHFKGVIEAAKNMNELEIVEKLSRYQDIGVKVTPIISVPDEYSVITHGDCWNNNFMFKYEDGIKDKPARVHLLDWQLSRLASPVLDLSYFLFTCISYDDIGRFDEINKIYYDSLSNFMRRLGSDPDKMFPFAEFQRQWMRCGKFGLNLMPSLIRLVLSEKDETIDFTESVEAGQKLTDLLDYKVKNIEEYEKRTVAVMKLAVERDFLNVTDLGL